MRSRPRRARRRSEHPIALRRPACGRRGGSDEGTSGYEPAPPPRAPSPARCISIPEGRTMRTKFLIATVLAAVFAAAGVTFASADSHSAGDDGAQSIELFAVTDQFAFIDADGSGE